MYWYDWSFWGMNFVWWAFWALMLITFFAVAIPVPRRRMRFYEHPLTILQRRFAAGEMTPEEYEQRKALIEQDVVRFESSAQRAGFVERRHFDRRQTA